MLVEVFVAVLVAVSVGVLVKVFEGVEVVRLRVLLRFVLYILIGELKF